MSLENFVKKGQAAQAAVDEVIKEKVPDAIRPRCPYCKADPLNVKRLRYDFPDGVAAEVIFCSACRAAVPVLLVGFTPPKPRP